ncbi:putative galactose transporter [Aspergillus vadensis CBS 113365]|uniref:Galactose transporter n=1 Tax=Aspergillus vadensis (strain CBS 113365 / IMI 142717 / IBT 24658) TaxID=1448311 RepID=A0A319C4H7_ASPVC|nr:putative galactose transporter [Aspergillus vadensis CBS 113365]PYH63702.1 putative galactose transporter [Aspergillus vadensis CBS 113365]
MRRTSVTGLAEVTGTSTGVGGLVSNRKCLGLALFASLGGVLYGYNQGVFSQVQVMADFEHRFASTPKAFSPEFWRSISAWCIVFMLGVALQVGATNDVAYIYSSRWFAGMGVGGLSVIVLTFNAELAPPSVRGTLAGLQQVAICLGIMVSYWIGYGTNYIGGTTYPQQPSAAWRIPLALQLVPAIVLCIGSWFLPYSPRWLMLVGREQESLAVLARLRNQNTSSPEVQYEYLSLKVGAYADRETSRLRYGTETKTWRTEVLEYKRIFTTKLLLHRVGLGAGVQAFGQWSGINAIIYYAPTVFAQVGLSGGSIGLLATGVVGILMFVFTIPGTLMVDKVGRKPMLAWSLVNMGIAHAIVAALIATYGSDFAEHKSAGNAAIFFIYWIVVNYSLPYGPVGWIVTAESSSLEIRAKGVSIGSAVNWIMNFAVAQVTPVMITNIGYKTFIVFFCYCALGLVRVYFVLPELKGLSLEEIDAVFADEISTEDRLRRERIADELGIHNVANAAANGAIPGYHGFLSSKQDIEMVEN